ncbi:hypothetical protein [Amycolatopsis samaneae]|uniref:ABC transmembrane type-1 domain-containing protein n=1 Tax=Amycolatopsis samaneae TaxID=664691 RepID=A0ABW5GA30_9PSEU
MTFAVGIFDLFLYAVPGACQLAFLVYLGARLHALDVARLTSLPAVLLVVVVVVVSYVLGHLTSALWAVVSRVLPLRGGREAARQSFLARNPQARERAYVHADTALLRLGVAVQDKEAAAQIDRVMSQGLMVRNLTLPLAFGFVAAVVELIAGGHRILAACCAVLLAASVAGAYREGRKLLRWADLRTWETCFWLPDIETALAAEDDAG